MLGVVRDMFQERGLNGRDHMRPPAVQRLNVGAPPRRVRRVEARQLAQRVVFDGVSVCGGETMQRSVFREEVDNAPAGELRRLEADHAYAVRVRGTGRSANRKDRLGIKGNANEARPLSRCESGRASFALDSRRTRF